MKKNSFLLLSILVVNLVFSQNSITREEAIAMVKKDCYAFGSLDEKYRADKEFVLLALKKCPNAFEFASKDLRKDE